MKIISAIAVLLLWGFDVPAQDHFLDSSNLKPSIHKRMIPTAWQLQKNRGTLENRNKRANEMATRAKDSLNLTAVQVSELISINRSLEQQKEQAFKKISGRNEARTELQRIELQRDKMYQAVFTREQFRRYLKIKRSILNER